MKQLLIILLSFGLALGDALPFSGGNGKGLMAQTVKGKKGKKKKKRGKTETGGKSTKSGKEKEQVDYLFIEANTQYLQEEKEEAISLLKEVLDVDKSHHASMYLIGKIAYELGDYSNSVKYAKMALDENQENIWYHYSLSQGYQGLRDLTRAIQVQEEMASRFPEEKEVLFDLAQLYIGTADYQKSVDVYDRLEQLAGPSEEVIFRKHQLYLYLNQPEKALGELDKLISMFPGETRYLQAKYDVLIMDGREAEGIQILEDLLARRPNDAFALLSLADYYQIKGDKEKSELYLLRAFENPEVDLSAKVRILGSMYPFADQDEKIKAQLQKLGDILYEVHPKDPLVDGIRGDIFQVLGQPDSAQFYYRESLDGEPASEKVWQELLIIDSEMGDFKGMQRDAEQALEYFPNQALFLYFFGVSSAQTEDNDGAIYAFEKIKKTGVTDLEILMQAYISLGEIYHEEKEFEKSDENFEEALELDGDNALVLNNFAYFLSLRNEQLDRAEDMVVKALKKAPTSSAYLDTYGWILYLKGDYQSAATQLGKAVEHGGEGEVLEHYGDVWLKLGDETKARDFWQRAIQSGSSDLDIDSKLREAGN